MSNLPPNQNINGQYNNQQNGQQYSNLQQKLMYMQYQQRANLYGVPSIPVQGYPMPMDPTQYQNYLMSRMPQKIMNPSITPQSQQQAQNSPSWNQNLYHTNSSPGVQQQHTSPQNMNYVHCENGMYKMQYRNHSNQSTPTQVFHSPNIQKQDLNGDYEQISSRRGYDYRNSNNCKQGIPGDRNDELNQHYPYDQQQRNSQGSNIPFEMFMNIEREIARERSKLRDCVSEDCRLVFGEIQKLEVPFTLYDVNGSKVYSIREVLAHLLPYHLYSFNFNNLSESSSTNYSCNDVSSEVKREKEDVKKKFDEFELSKIDEIRQKMDNLAIDSNIVTTWRCYKSIIKSIMNHNFKLNEPSQAAVGENDCADSGIYKQQNDGLMIQQPISYSQRMGYMQYNSSSSWPGHPPPNHSNPHSPLTSIAFNRFFKLNNNYYTSPLIANRFINSLTRNDKVKEYEQKLKPFTFDIPLPSLYDRIHLFIAKCLTYGWLWVGIGFLCLCSMGFIELYARYDEKGRYCL